MSRSKKSVLALVVSSSIAPVSFATEHAVEAVLKPMHDKLAEGGGYDLAEALGAFLQLSEAAQAAVLAMP